LGKNGPTGIFDHLAAQVDLKGGGRKKCRREKKRRDATLEASVARHR